MSNRANLELELFELRAANANATSWGAAVGARSERIKEIERELRRMDSSAGAPSRLSQGGDAVIEGDAVVIRFPLEAMQSALDGAWGLNVFDRRQKVTDEAEFAKEFCRELNAESENGTTLIHRMADKAFVNMIEGGAFGFNEYEEQSL